MASRIGPPSCRSRPPNGRHPAAEERESCGRWRPSGLPAKGNKCNLDGRGRTISSLPGVFEVYLEDYSPATEIPSAAPDLAAWAGSRALARRQQGLDLGAARGRHAAAQTRAFEAGRRRGEPQRRDHVAAFGERERERVVEHVAGAQRVDRLDRKDRAAAQRGGLAPKHVPRALGDGEKRRCRGGNRGERGAEVVETGGGAQA